MKYYKIDSLKNRFQEFNPEIRPNNIKSFFSEKNLFGNLSIKNFYTLPTIKSAYINEEDAIKVCLLAKLKFEGVFDLSNIKSIVYVKDLKENNVENLLEFKSKMIEHYRSPLFIEKIKAEKDRVNSLKTHKQDFSKNIDNYNVDIKNKKIVSIDFEYNPKVSNNQNDIKNCSECGISIYENNELTTLHFIIEDGTKRTGLSKVLVDKFEFGESKLINSEELILILKEKLKDADYFISHGIENEYNILEGNGIDISLNNTEILDTWRMFRKLDVNSELNSYRLKDIVRACDMNDNNLHNSGNDAAYTLKTFLEMNKSPEKMISSINKLTNHYDETRPKRKSFKLK